MRFVLDRDVDIRVRRVLTARSHEAWQAPPHLERDDDISAYADDKNAAVITHDVEFTYRRRRHTFGQHIRLMCEQTDAVKVMELHHDELIELMSKNPTGVFIVSNSRVEFKPPRWD